MEKLTYISLFSGAGIGCFGFKDENFSCIATNEILEKRLNIQKINKKCKYETGYIAGDICNPNIKNLIFNEIDFWKINENINDVDVIVATPPCQGMSVANHNKKNNEINRNSLVVESIEIINKVKPKFFIFENVRTFLGTKCVTKLGEEKTIKETIFTELSDYKIGYGIIDFKNYGNPTKRTRTIVIGVRGDIKDITAIELMPQEEEEKTLKQTIGHLKTLKVMGEIDDTDIFHNFKEYSMNMLPWIEKIKEGESAFDNKDNCRKPHRILNGKMVINVNKNGDKYKRCYWDKSGYCVHTRNDILASQWTIHPSDNRVFSIRELMLMMSLPNSFKWFDINEEELNNLPLSEKKQIIKKEEMNIRQSLGEGVPTIIFKKIANNIKNYLSNKNLKKKKLNTMGKKVFQVEKS